MYPWPFTCEPWSPPPPPTTPTPSGPPTRGVAVTMVTPTCIQVGYTQSYKKTKVDKHPTGSWGDGCHSVPFLLLTFQLTLVTVAFVFWVIPFGPDLLEAVYIWIPLVFTDRMDTFIPSPLKYLSVLLTHFFVIFVVTCRHEWYYIGGY